MSNPAPPSATDERKVSRDIAATGPGRCVMYAIFSDLLASPFDATPAVAGSAIDVESLLLPYELGGLQALLDEWRDTPLDVRKRLYSGMFEVGSDGPPVPIREDLHLRQPAGVREYIVRFYEYFGYGLEEKLAWEPDHLSIELAFMHFLCFKETQTLDAAAGADASSFQLAQIDFAERHLCNWVSELAEKAIQQQPDGIYPRLLAALSEFVVKDYQWQAGTIT